MGGAAARLLAFCSLLRCSIRAYVAPPAFAILVLPSPSPPLPHLRITSVLSLACQHLVFPLQVLLEFSHVAEGEGCFVGVVRVASEPVTVTSPLVPTRSPVQIFDDEQRALSRLLIEHTSRAASGSLPRLAPTSTPPIGTSRSTRTCTVLARRPATDPLTARAELSDR